MAHVVVLLLFGFYHLGLTTTAEFSVLIPVTRNAPALFLKQCLESLKSLDDVQVILVQEENIGYEKQIEINKFLSVISLSHPPIIVKAVEKDTPGKTYNRAAKMANSKYLVFMDAFVSLSDATVFETMAAVLKADSRIGVVGAKIVFPDDTLHHFGINLVVESKDWEWGVTEYLLGVTYPLQGYSANHPQTRGRKDVAAVSKDLMMLERELFEEVGGFFESYESLSFIDADLCLLITNKTGRSVVVDPSAKGIHHNKDFLNHFYDYSGDNPERHDLIKFNEMWSALKMKTLTDPLELKKFVLIWNMECGYSEVLGFTSEAIHFLLSLEGKVRVQANVGHNQRECVESLQKVGYPMAVIRSMKRMMAMAIPNDVDTVLVLHRDPGRYRWFLSSKKKDSYVVGRSMYETDRIPDDWVGSCNDPDIEEIWVPSQFNVDTFKVSGVNVTKLSVLPELVDTDHFDPTSHSPLFPLERGVFSFLTVLKWEDRKAWKILFKAFFDEFRGAQATKKVQLNVLCRMGEQEQTAYKNFLETYHNETKNVTTPLPEINFINHFIPYSLLPSLYMSADAFVLASHGEGWGLPLMEAMAMKIPAIGTNWGGNTAFMNSKNSFLVDVESMNPASTAGHKWAKPSISSLRQIMRSLYSKPGMFSSITTMARNDVTSMFSYAPVSALLIEKLIYSQAQIPAMKERKAKTLGSSHGRFDGAHSWKSWASSGGSHTPPIGGSTTKSKEPSFKDANGITRYRAKVVND